jgi:predicted O-linked N-acetylglucosamine transferase (SPINDLY family)
MRLLAKVEGSVLWLFEDNAEAASNLRREATLRNISADRLVFAQRTDLATHLARHQCADLFLDTFPCNAHTTASDALLTGLPVLTLAGSTFSSRVAASLLKAVNLEELITTRFDEYEALALALSTAPGKIEGIRKRLKEGRENHLLFDSARYVGNLEHLLKLAHERQSAGLAPENISVPFENQLPLRIVPT